MSENALFKNRAIEGTAIAERRAYGAPSLVRYGSLFVQTSMTCEPSNNNTCSKGTDNICDPCDPDGGADGNKKN